MDTFSEETLENDMVEKFQQKGWRFVPASELERDSLEEPLLLSSLIMSIKKINSGSGLGNEEIKQVIDELKFLSGNEGTKKILAFP
ncbi:hypothetical protein IPdc08_01359 [archaeon]|nr:hypothetical protein IPdc08_01359 [archaeon]